MRSDPYNTIHPLSTPRLVIGTIALEFDLRDPTVLKHFCHEMRSFLRVYRALFLQVAISSMHLFC